MYLVATGQVAQSFERIQILTSISIWYSAMQPVGGSLGVCHGGYTAGSSK